MEGSRENRVKCQGSREHIPPNRASTMILKIAVWIPSLDGHQQWSWTLLTEYFYWMAYNNDLEHCWPNTFTGWPTTMIRLNIVNQIPLLDGHKHWSWTLLTEYLCWMATNDHLEHCSPNTFAGWPTTMILKLINFFFCRNGGMSDWRGVSRNIIWKNLW